MVPNQRHDSNCTIPRHLHTDHISHGDVAVSIILCSCVPHSAQQCCSAFLSPKIMHHLAKEKARTACVVLPVCFSSAAKCSWSSVLNFKAVSQTNNCSLFVCQMCKGILWFSYFLYPSTDHPSAATQTSTTCCVPQTEKHFPFPSRALASQNAELNYSFILRKSNHKILRNNLAGHLSPVIKVAVKIQKG